MEVYMFRIKSIFKITLFCFGAYLGADEPLCECAAGTHAAALENYKEALRLSFDEHWAEAEEASDCAGWINHGSKNWAFDAKKLLK